METCPAARLMIAEGMKKGEILRGPPLSRALCSRSMVLKPPIPEAMKTPTSVPSPPFVGSPASRNANSDAAIAYWMKTSIFRTSFFDKNCNGSKSGTSPAIREA